MKRFVVFALVLLLGIAGFLVLRDRASPAVATPESAGSSKIARSDLPPTLKGSADEYGRVSAADRAAPEGRESQTLQTSALAVRVVRLVDPSVPIAGARIDVRDRPWSAVADAAGRCVLPTLDLSQSPSSLIVSAEGYATEEIEWPAAADRSEFLVALADEGSISGRVVCRDGHPIDAGVLVLAWRNSTQLAPESVTSACAGRPSRDVHVARTNDRGEFRLRGLDPDPGYRVWAVGRGYWGKDSVGPISAGKNDVECRVQSAFGAVVQVVSADGSPVPDSRLLARGPGWSSRVEGVEPWILLDAELALLKAVHGTTSFAGVDEIEVGSWKSSVVLFLREDCAVHTAISVDFEVEAPGCEPVRASIDLPWTGAAGLARVDLKTKCSPCLGDVVLEPIFPGGPGWNARSSITLRDVSSARAFQAVVDPFDGDLMQLQGVPCGTYDVRLSAYHTILGWPAPGSPPVLVDVRSGETTKVDLSSWARLGRVEIELVDQKGISYRDAASFEFEFEHRGELYSRNALHARHAPFRCALMPAANWAVRVRMGAEGAEVLEPRTEFTVLPGQTTNVTIPIQR